MVIGTGGGNSIGNTLSAASCDENNSDSLAARAGLVWEVNSSRNTMVIGTGGGQS